MAALNAHGTSVQYIETEGCCYQELAGGWLSVGVFYLVITFLEPFVCSSRSLVYVLLFPSYSVVLVR